MLIACTVKLQEIKNIIYIKRIFFFKAILRNKPKRATVPNSQELKQIQPARFRKLHTRPGQRCLSCLPIPERTGMNLSNSGQSQLSSFSWSNNQLHWIRKPKQQRGEGSRHTKALAATKQRQKSQCHYGVRWKILMGK